MEMTKLIPLTPPGQNQLARWSGAALCDKALFPGTLLTGKEAPGEDAAGTLSFPRPPTPAHIHCADLIGRLLCGERAGQGFLWRRLISSGPVFVVIGGAMDPIYVYCPLTFLKRSLQSRKPYSEDRFLGSKVDRV